MELRSPNHRDRKPAALQDQLTGVLRAVIAQRAAVAADNRDVDDVWRRWTLGQDIDQPAGAAQIDCEMTPPVDGCMDHALGTVQRRLEPSSGSKINTSTPAC